MKNNLHLPAILATGALLVMALVFINGDLRVVAEVPNNAAVINSQSTNQGTKYSVTSERASFKISIDSLITYGEMAPMSSLKTFSTKSPQPIVQVQDADMIPRTPLVMDYVVELSEQPLSLKYKDLKTSSAIKNDPSAIKSSLDGQKAKISRQQDSFLSSLASSVKAKNDRISSLKSKKFSIVLNALVISANSEEIEQIKKLSGVKHVEPVQKVHAFLMDSVPLINAPQVWSGTVANTPLTGMGIKIAIIDTGVDYTHPDLGGCLGLKNNIPCKVAGGWDFINNDADPMDDMGHGTHVAAIAASNGALKGVAPDATIYAYKVLNAGGGGSSETVIGGLEMSADPNGDGNFSDHMDIASLSLGGPGNSDDSISRAVDNAVAEGVVVVVAAGNSGPSENSIGSPGAAKGAITVAATDKSDNVASFSSRGPVIWTDDAGKKQYLLKPDVSAPGVNICAARYAQAFPEGNASCNHDSNHVAISGTSMATPHVAGEAALLLQFHHDWSPVDVKMAIRKGTVLPDSLLNYSETTRGTGRINVLQTVQIPKLPIAILSPVPEAKNIVPIRGTASGQNFSKYSISYKTNGSSSYTNLYTSSTTIIDNVLYNLDSTRLSEGLGFLKLTVADTAGNISEDVAVVNVNNFEITGVGNNSNYITDGVEPVYGSLGNNLSAPVEFKVLITDNRSLSNQVVCSGTSLANGGLICNGDFGTLPNNKYTLFLQVRQNGQWKTDTSFEMAIVKELLTNWPQTIFGFGRGVHSVIGTEADQFVKELFVPYYVRCIVGECGWGSTLLKYKSDGTSVLQTSLNDGSEIPNDPIFSTYYDSIGKKNYFVMADYNALKIVGPGGIVYKKLPTNQGDWSYSPTTVFDGNGDGVPEIYGVNSNFSTHKVKIFGYDFQGKVLKGFPIAVPQGSGQYPLSSTHVSLLKTTPTASSSMSQHNLALVAGDYNEPPGGWLGDLKLYVHIFSADGTLKTSTPLYDGTNKRVGLEMPFPVVTDLDGDGNSEFIVMLSVLDMDLIEQNRENIEAYKTYIKVFDSNGNIVSTKQISGYTAKQIAIGKFGTASPNIVVVLGDTWLTTGQGHKIMLLDKTLSTISEKNEIDLDIRNPIIQNLSIGDVDGDGVSEVVLSYRPRYFDEGNSGIYILSQNLSLKRNIVIPTMGSVDDLNSGPIVLDDFDNNGTLDAVLQSYVLQKNPHNGFGNSSNDRIYALNLGGSSGKKIMDWKTLLHDDAHTGCFGCIGSSTLVVIPQEIAPKAKIIDTPTLSLVRDPIRGVDSMVSTFHVKIDAGSDDQKIRKGNAFNVYLKADSGAFVVGTEEYTQPAGTINTDGYYIIPAGSSVVFNVTFSNNVPSDASGIFTATLDQVNLGDQSSIIIVIPAPNTTNSLTINRASVSIVSTPVLRMIYYPDGGENRIISIFRVKVDAGNQDQKIDKNNAFYTYLRSEDSHTAGGESQYSQPKETTDDGNGFYVISAGTSATFSVTMMTNPKSMFAGNYHGILELVRIGDVNNTKYIPISPPNTTNFVTVIGEKSPYINSVSPNPVPTNQLVTISGVRFAPTGNILTLTRFIKNEVPVPIMLTLPSIKDGEIIQFVPNLPIGDYGIQVTHPTTGASNIIGLTVTYPVTTKSLTLNSASIAPPYMVGNIIPIKWTSTGVSRVSIALYSLDGTTKIADINTVSASLESYSWRIPLDYDGSFTIRISDASDPTLYKSSGKIDIIPHVTSQPVAILPWSGPASVVAGSNVNYTLNWFGGPMSKSWQTFVQLVRSTDGLEVAADNYWSLVPTIQWSQGVSTSHSFIVPANTPPGIYKVMVSLQDGTARATDLTTNTSFPAESPFQNRYQVGTITISPIPVMQKIIPGPTDASNVWDSLRKWF